jgi:hypothetical protein
LANDPAAARQLSPMDPRAIHPVIHGRTAHSCDLPDCVDWQELGFFPAALTEKSSHDHTAIDSA